MWYPCLFWPFLSVIFISQSFGAKKEHTVTPPDGWHKNQSIKFYLCGEMSQITICLQPKEMWHPLALTFKRAEEKLLDENVLKIVKWALCVILQTVKRTPLSRWADATTIHFGESNKRVPFTCFTDSRVAKKLLQPLQRQLTACRLGLVWSLVRWCTRCSAMPKIIEQFCHWAEFTKTCINSSYH